jgi:hypothetical protein
MSAVRELRARRRFRIQLIVAVAVAAAAVVDWTRPAEQQASVYIYEHGIIAPYRVAVRPIASLFVRCRYRPTCSQYSAEAVRAHGFPAGAWFTLKRLFRCMPWVPFGTTDPVPPRRAARVISPGSDVARASLQPPLSP